MKKLIRKLILLTVLSTAIHSETAHAIAWTEQPPYEEIKQIHLPFVSFGKKVFAWDFPYTD